MIGARDAELEAAVQRALAAAKQTGEIQFAALQREAEPCDPLAAFASARASERGTERGTERFYWERPAQARALAAFGRAAAIEPTGEARFEAAATRAARLFASVHLAARTAPAWAGPLLVGGFSFSSRTSEQAHWRGFASSRLILPELAISSCGSRCWWTAVRPVASTDDPLAIARDLHERLLDAGRSLAAPGWLEAPPEASQDAPAEFRVSADRGHGEYRALVAAALREIAAGSFEKVVLARSVAVRARRDHDEVALLRALRRDHPSCAVFAIASAEGAFLGATPECLVRMGEGRVETASVAGSAPRGRSPEEDRELGRRLRESKKEQAEHAVVVRTLCEALAPHCEDLDVREAPRLMRLQDIQHLETPIAGRLRAPISILELLGSLHPTPALAGAPREAALRWLADNERLDRGWYGGPVGFVDCEGGGEFYAALRSAIVRGDEARLFAGAGIVAGSDPLAELAETRLKLRAMLAPLLEI
ncbi:MAG TPA: isochorismate synthase [Myxococcota bacterium]|nr:isochorismate synthase [Myxococcota bacterium]